MTPKKERKPLLKRGRPKTENPMTDAERARLYRLRKKEKEKLGGKKSGVGKPESPSILELQKDLATMTDIASKLIEEKLSRKKLDRTVFANLCKAHLKIQMKHKFL